jgi:two-component system sensor histidine kinase/response regulator
MNYDMVFLVVDDMDGMRRIIARNLSQMGLKHILTANSGADAWRILQAQKVDAVITDWNMPVMSGLELVKQIRSDARFAKLPILMMTAETEHHQVRLAIEAGVSDFMIKPFNVSNLETKLKKIIQQPRLASATVAGKPSQPKAKAPDSPPTAAARIVATRPGNEPGALVLDDEFKARLASKATLLAIDDVPDNLDVLVELLGDEYLVKVATSGERALKSLESGKIPDLILLDVMMPEMDGFEVCRRIKANPVTAGIPVIFLTAMSEAADVTRGFELGAVDFVSKPADPPILRARIRTHLSLRRSMDEIKRTHAELKEQHAILADNLRLREDVDRISRHDMKNPIGGIINYASMLLEDATLNEDQKAVIRDMEQSAYGVLNMVNLSLDLYRMEQGSYEFNPVRVNLRPLFDRIIREKQSELDSRQLSHVLLVDGKDSDREAPFYVLGDELLCYSMFGNLFKNAIEASTDGDEIRIDLREEETAANIVMINRGAVPHRIRASFFDKYVTADKTGGTGFGTFSARLIAITQLGNITMQASDEDNNTTISVTLPLPKVA